MALKTGSINIPTSIGTGLRRVKITVIIAAAKKATDGQGDISFINGSIIIIPILVAMPLPP